ncbi:phytoene desaturase family protein [Arthrobacter sp. H14]|uniref:phytoene desaturase family protein n=1 Tax=Arthrobacter sp. H14 TaxID=1312959 RepID=UPI0004B6BD36|nr:phytoene desaturase family protein [Arthrobacter sp. H14]
MSARGYGAHAGRANDGWTGTGQGGTGIGKRVTIIGAGVAGLAGAALLSKAGYSVTVLEKQPEPGGRAGSWEHDGFRFDTGPSWYLMPDVFHHFFALLGTSTSQQLDLLTLDPAYRVFFQDEKASVDMHHGKERNVATFEGLERGAGAALERYLESAKKTYHLAKKYFLYTSFASFRPLLTPEVLRNLPQLARLLLQPLDRFAARYVKDGRLQKILGYPAVFLGSAPNLAPSMYHLMSHLDLAGSVLYPQGGFTSLVDSLRSLAQQHGARVICNANVTEILTAPGKGSRNGKAQVSGVRYADADGTAHTSAADIVVSAADLHHTETRLLPEKLRTYPARYWKKRVPGPGALLLLLGVEGKLPELVHHNLLFTTDWTKNFKSIFGREPAIPDPASLYVCKPSASDPTVAPAGDENLFVLVPIPADISLGSGGIAGGGDSQLEQLAEVVIAQIAEWTGVKDLRRRITVRKSIGPGDFAADFNAWNGTALGPAHTLRQSAFLRGRNMSSKVQGLYYCGGSTIPGVGLPMCLISAEILLKRLTGDTSTTALPEPTGSSSGSDGEKVVRP